MRYWVGAPTGGQLTAFSGVLPIKSFTSGMEFYDVWGMAHYYYVWSLGDGFWAMHIFYFIYSFA